MGLLLHQHGHVLDITTPEVQPLLHTFDLKQWITSQTNGLCASFKNDSAPLAGYIFCDQFKARSENTLLLCSLIYKYEHSEY